MRIMVINGAGGWYVMAFSWSEATAKARHLVRVEDVPANAVSFQIL